MHTRPLEYDSLKTVIQQMDPNLRFYLCLMLPSYRKIDRVVPLKIDSLVFKPYQFNVNDTKYRLGMYLDYGDNEEPGVHRQSNDRGGAPWDFDKYGFRDASADKISTPGDVVIQSPLWPPFIGPQTDEQAENNEAQLKVLEYILAKKQGKDVGPPPVSEDDPNFFLIDQCKHYSVEFLQKFVDQQLDGILPFRYRRTGTLPPYKKFVKLSVSDLSGPQYYYDFKEHCKLHNVQKSLTDVLFGHRDSIFVKTLVMDCYNIRLPLGLKLKIREFSLDRDAVKVCEAFLPIIDESSYPLKVANIYGHHDFNHPILNNAEELVIFRNFLEFDALLRMRNRRIILKYAVFTVGNYIQLVENLRENPRVTGTCMRFGIVEVGMMATVLGRLETRFENVQVGRKSVTIPMRDQRRRIVVSYESTPNSDSYRTQGTLIVKVEEGRSDN